MSDKAIGRTAGIKGPAIVRFGAALRQCRAGRSLLREIRAVDSAIATCESLTTIGVCGVRIAPDDCRTWHAPIDTLTTRQFVLDQLRAKRAELVERFERRMGDE